MTTQTERQELATELNAVLADRSAIYLMLAGWYFKPLTAEQIDVLAATDFATAGAGDDELASGFNDISRFLRKRHTGTRQMLATDYTGAFGGAQAWAGKRAVPYASVFLSEEGLYFQAPRNEALATYKQQQLMVTDRSTPDDHLSFEFEFLSILSDRAAKALAQGKYSEVIELLATSKDFITGQILTWFPLLKELASNLISTRFYRGVLKVTNGYLALDLETIDEVIAQIEGLEA